MISPKRFTTRASVSRRLVLAGLVVVLTLAGAPRPGAVGVKTDDGLEISLDEHGAIDGVRLGARPLPIRGTGGFFVVDAAAAGAAVGGNLVQNGDFSSGTQSWTVTAGREIVPGEDALYSKGNSAFVAAPPPNQVSRGMIWQTVPVRPNTGYTFAADMKTEKCAGAAAHLWLSQFARDGKTVSAPMIVVQSAPADSGGNWVTVRRDLVTGPETRYLQIRQGIYQGFGKVWLDDVRLVVRRNLLTAARPLTGVLTSTDNAVRLQADSEPERLQLDAVVRGVGGRIAIAGTLTDTSGQDRCVVLWVRLPLELDATWSFGYDLETALPLADQTSVYGNSQTFVAGQAMAQYPWGCVYDRESGLALSVPMDQPRVCRLEYLPGSGCYAVFELGLSPATAKFPSQATFYCDVYQFEPEWGFRAAARRYYELFPHYFRRHATAGDRSWGAYEIVDWSKQARPLDCGDCMASFSFHGNRSILDDRAAGKVTVSYIEPNGYWNWRIGHKPYPKTASRPPYAELLADLETRAREGQYAITARRILQTAVANATGELTVNGWVPAYGGAHWLCNSDPDLPDAEGSSANQGTDAWEHCLTQCNAYDLDGVYSDAGPGGFSRNFHRDHFAYVDHPLTFDPQTHRVCYLMPFHMFEFYAWLTPQLHARNLCLLMHWSSCGYPTFVYGLNWADTIGNEQHGAAMSRNQYLTQRVLAYQKPVQSYTQCAKVSREMGRRYTLADLAYGVFSNNSRDPVVSRLYMGLQRELSAAGWEPVTWARAVAGTVKLERFGRLRDANLHFTVRNETAAVQQAEIELSAALPGLADAALCFQVVDHLYAAEAPASIAERRISVRVEPGMTRVVRIGTRERLADMLRPEFERQWVGARNFAALADGEPLPRHARAMLAGRPLALPAVVRKIMAQAVAWSGAGAWQRHTALALAEADFIETMIRLLQQGAWAEFPVDWPGAPGHPLVLGPGMAATVPTGILVNGEAREARLVSLLPQVKTGTGITVTRTAPEGLYPLCLEWDEPGMAGGPCRWYFDVQVGKPLRIAVVPARLPASLAGNLTVQLTNLTVGAMHGRLALIPPHGWQVQPDTAEVAVGGGRETAVAFTLSTAAAVEAAEVPLMLRFESADTEVEQSLKLPLLETPLLECAPVRVAPAIDGNLDDACWQGRPDIPGLQSRLPDAGTPTQQTRAWVCRDAEHLYVAVRCDEAKMHEVKRTVTENNGPVWSDDSLEVWLVPQHQTNRAAQLIANLLDKHYSSSVLPGWTTAAATHEDGWSMEFRIPFACLNEPPPRSGDVWGFNLGRTEHPHQETTAWSPPGFHYRASDGSILFK